MQAAGPTKSYHPVIPLHYQIQRILRTQIESGQWAVGEQLPPEIDLMGRFKVSRTTMRRALRWLESDGIIVRQRGKGTFLARTNAVGIVEREIKSLLLGYRAEVQVLGIDTIPAPLDIASALKLKQGEPVRRFRRLEIVDGFTLAVVFNYLRPEIGSKITVKDLERHSMLEVLRDHLKIALGTLQQTIAASLPDETVARLLRTDVSQPVLAVRLIANDQWLKPIQVCQAYYRGDWYRYEVETLLSPDTTANIHGIVDCRPSGKKRN